MITLRIDVDYPYASRARSFVNVAFGLRVSSSYLRNAKIIARMINESSEDVKAYWFFTPKTIPDKELLALLHDSRHEVALHIVNDPNKELNLLERATRRKLNYYTFHGTSRLLARIMWKRWKANKPKIPEDFPLESFHKLPTTGLDRLRYNYTTEQTTKIARSEIGKGHILHIHPIWLFQKGTINHRGPYYETLRRILNVDKEMETISIRKKLFFRIARDWQEYQKDVVPTKELIQKVAERGVDIFNFLERKWCNQIPNPAKSWVKTDDNIGLLHLTTFGEWQKNIGKKTRNMIRKAEKSGIKVEVVEPSEKLAEGIWKIYNEAPIRQERGFPHYGVSLQTVRKDVLSQRDSTYVGAYLEEELVGFIQLVHGDNITIISQILSMQKHLDKAVNNALIAKVVEFCASKQIKWIMYGRMGNHPTLDNFKQSNGFTKFQLARYYIPLTRRGKMAIKLGSHREIKDSLPQSIKIPLIPVYNWVSRTKARFSLLFKPKQLT